MLSSRRFQHGFDRVNLLRLTTCVTPYTLVITVCFTSLQGLTLVHFSAQLEPCLTQETTLHTLDHP